jgi:inorganic triphosphatase YgiF
VSLRIRTNADLRVQTFKRGAGLARQEHESVVTGEVPDLTRPPFDGLLSPRRRARLKPAFSVDLVRRQRLIAYQDAAIELAFDDGLIQAGDGTAPVCEVELELKSGPPQALFALARELAHAAPLYLSFESKAAQGYALAEGRSLTPRRDPGVRVSKGLSAAQAFQAIARGALAQIAANAALLRQAPSAEALHQLRVAARRLRGAMAVFKSVTGDDRAAWIKAELKWLTSACGEARALDVLAQTMLADALKATPDGFGLAELSTAVEAARRRAGARAAAAVASARFRALVLETYAWVELGDWISRPAAGVSGIGFLGGALTRRRRKVMKAGQGLRDLDDEGRHKVRIAAKVLRYAAETLADRDEPRARRFIAALKRLQDHLGALNDAAGLAALLTGLKLEGSAQFAAGRLAGAAEAGQASRIRQAAKAMSALARVEPFWDS